MRKSKFKQTMSMLLAVLMVFMSMNFSVFAEELTAPTDETTTTTVEAPAEQPAEKQTPAVEALAPVDEETGTTEENTTDNSLQQEQSVLLQAPVTNGEAIAKIDDQDYIDQAAFLTTFNALTGAHAVQLLADIDLGSSNKLNVLSGGQVTFDLNGCTIKAAINDKVLTNEGTLIIEDTDPAKEGSIENTPQNKNPSSAATIYNKQGAALTVEGGKISSVTGIAIGNEGTAKIHGGIIETTGENNTYGSSSATAAIQNYGALDISKKEGNDNTVLVKTNQAFPIWISSKNSIQSVTTIAYGDFRTDKEKLNIKVNSGHADCSVTVTGGTWDKDPSAYITPNCSIGEDNGIYSVIKSDPQTQEVTSLQELKAALKKSENSWQSINITNDITVTEDLEVPDKAYLTIQSGKTLKITDNSKINLKGYLKNLGTLDICEIGSGWINDIARFENSGQISGLPNPENGVYKISTINQLQFMHYVILQGESDFTEKIELQNPIDATGYRFMAMGDGSKCFAGTFDGKKQQLDGLTIHTVDGNASLFNTVYGGANFIGLNFKNCDASTDNGYLGILAGETYGPGTIIVKDSEITGKAASSTSFYCGGLIGSLWQGDYKFENCHLNIDINGFANVGPFWGSATGTTSNISIINCSNSGNITAEGKTYGIVGGYGYGNYGNNGPLIVTMFDYNYSGTITVNGEVIEKPQYCTSGGSDQFILAVAKAQEADGSYHYYGTLQDAVNQSAENSVIEIAPGTYNLESILRIQKPLTLKGLGDVIITRGDTWEPTEGAATDRETGSLVLIENTVDAILENVTIQNAKTVTGSGLKAQGHGINIVDSQNIHLNNITTKNNAASGLVVNSSEVFAHNLYTSDNGWYGINLDQNKDESGNPQGSAYFELTYDDGIKPEDAITDATQIYADHGRNESYSIDASLPAQFKRYNSGSEAFLWSTSEMGNGVYIEQSGKKVYYPTIQSAIDAAESGSTVYVGTGSFGTGTTNAPGTININKDITVEGQGKDQTLIADKMLITGNCKVKLSKIKIDIPLEGTADGFVAVQIGTQDSNSAQANVTIDQCVINQDKGGVDVSSKAVLIEKGGSGSILTIDASDITGSADRDTYLNLVRNNSDNSNITINNSNLKVKDENYECQYLNALVILGKNSTYNLNDSIIKASGFGISVNDGSDNIETGNKININHSTVESTGGRDTQGEIFYGGVAIDMYVGAHQTLNITNNSIIKAASITDGSVRAISFLSSKGSVTNIKDSTVYGGGYGIIAQSGSDNMSLNVENSSIVGSEIYGVELSTNTPVVKINNSIIQTNAGFSNSAAMFISQGAKVTVDKNSHLIAQNALGIYITASKDEGYKWGGKAGKVNLDFSGTINAKTGIVQSQFCGNGDKSDGPIEITLGPTAKIYALDNGFEFNSAYESTGAAAIKADKNAKVYAPVLVVKGENAVTDISQLDTLKFYAVSDVFTYDQETGAITLKEAAIENQTSGEKYLSIQEAIDNAYNNDRIYVPAGEYSENIKLTKAVKLIGAKEGISANDAARDGTEETILKGSVTFDNTKTIRSTLIDGFTFTGSAYIHAEYWSGNLNKPKISNVVIQNNIFKDIDTTVSGKNNAAIHLNCGPGQEVDNVTIQNNQFKNITSSHAEGTEAAAFSTNCFSGNLIISNNVIDTTEGNAITITPHEDASNVKVSITNNTIKNWKNRAIRMNAVKGVIDINQNSMIPGEKTIAGPDTPQIIKITSSDAANAEYNYWGTENPTFKQNGENPSVISGDINPYPYYSASDMSEESLKNAPAIIYYKEASEEKVRGMYGDIQEAVNAAKADDTIILNADEYLLEAPVQIDKALTIKAGTNAAPWVKAAQNQNAFTVTGDIIGSLSFDGVNITTQTAPTGNESPKGIDVQQKTISGSLIYKNAEIKDMYYGILVSVNSSEAKAKVVDTLDINHAVFTDNLHKAVYVENANTVKVDSTTFTGDASTGTEYWPTRIALDINEKYNRYDSVSVTNCTFNNIQGTPGTPSQEGQVGYGAALAVKARNDGSYADPAASLKNVTITGNTFIGNTCDLMIGEPAAEGKVAEHTWNLGTVNIQKNAFSSKVQNNYKQKTDTSQNYWGSETPNFTALTAGLIEVYPYYTNAEMTKLYAPIELRSADGKKVKYFGIVKDAFTVANDSDTVVINQTSDGQPATVDEPIDMNVVSGSKLITVNLQLEGSTTFNKAFTGTTKGHMILSTGKNADQPTIAIFNGSVDGFVSVDAVNFDSAKAPVIKALSSETDPNSFISKTGVLSVSEEGDYRIWTYGSPSENFNGGDGSEAKPYQINTADQLKLLAKDGFNTKKYFKLTNDIAVNDWTALAKFEGNFDGNGYSITGNSVNFIDALAAGAKVEKLRFEGFTNLVNTNNGTVENCFTVGEKPTAIVNIMESGGALTDSFTAGTKAVQTNEAQGTVLHVYHCGETGGIGTAMTKADMQKARFANMLNSGTEGVWDYNADVEAPSAYPFVMVDGGKTTIQNLGKVTVTCDESIGSVTVKQPEDGLYLNDEVTLSASINNQFYDFGSWFINKTKLLSTHMNYTYQLKSAEDVGEITGTFVEKEKATITALVMDGNGKVSIDDSVPSNLANATSYVGSTTTLKAIPNDGYRFAKWTTLTDTSTIVSTDPTFTFRTGTGQYQYIAWFEKVVEDQVTVTFRNSVTDTVMEMQTIKKGSDITPPVPSVYANKTFDGWYVGDKKVELVEGKIFNVTSDMTLEARYKVTETTYTVKVENGIISGTSNTEVQMKFDDPVTVVANKPEENMNFAGWSIDGSIVSYNTTYTFYVKGNTTITATYTEAPVEVKPTVFIDPKVVQFDQGAGFENLYKLQFVIRSNIPEDLGYTPVKCGIVFRKADVLNSDELSINGTNVTVGGKTDITNIYTYTAVISKLPAGQVVSARGYVTYMKNGVTETIYTDMVKGIVVENK